MSWFLIFEREGAHRAPGSVLVSGGPAGGGVQHRAPYHTFKPLMVLETPSSETAIQAAMQLTGRIGDWYAIEVAIRTVDVFPPTPS